jgi:hypothetical protein
MNVRYFFIIALFVLFPDLPVLAQLVNVQDFAPRVADSIRIERNWRTHSNIILAELEFNKGDTVDQATLARSLKKIWNLQNFLTVDYRWESLPDGRSVLVLTARDAVTIVPIFGGRMQWPDFTVKGGLADRNFLGRNIRLETRAQFSTNENLFGEVRLMIPRQLLWENMSLTAGFLAEELPLDQLVSRQAFLQLVNPFHEDYEIILAPDIEIGWIRHARPDPKPMEPFDLSYWYVRLTENFGTITHKRHQEEGLSVQVLTGFGVGLNGDSRNYVRASLKAEYDYILNQRLQLSTYWEGHYTTNENPSFRNRYGPGDIRGISYGDISGPLMHKAAVSLNYTWLNLDWLALEQSVFVQYASAMEVAGDPASIRRHYALGTGFEFTVPWYPAAGILISFAWNPNRSNWFYVEL